MSATPRTQADKGIAFAALHRRGRAFVIPNPWDAGSARILESLGFEALATTSSGFANSLGRTDGAVTREEMLAHCASICAATDLPVSADLEDGYGERPETVAETVRLAANAGLAGCSIEDWCGASAGIHDIGLATQRVAAAAEAARGLPFPFTLTARAENLIRGVTDLDDTIRRLQAFEAAGADVVYAPGLGSVDQVRTVCRAVGVPVNVLAPMVRGAGLDELEQAGATRLSVGGALARAAYGSLVAAARAMQATGRFDWSAGIIGGAELARLLR